MTRSALGRTLLALALLALGSGAVSAAAEPDRAEVGPMPHDAAPPLVASKWIRGTPVTRFERGRVYVVDLWATWCPPCLASMPHMSRLQARYAKDLTVIAMDVLEFKPDKVPAVVASLGDSMAVTVAMDSLPAGKEANEGMTAVAYLGSAEFFSLPRTILIDRQGRIAWIGTPFELDGPLSSVIAGKWDVEPFAAGFAANLAHEQRYRDGLRRVEAAIAASDWAAAYRESDAVAAADSSFGTRIANQGFGFIAMRILRLDNPPADTAALARRATERALELAAAPDWRLYKLAASTARAAGDRDAARAHLQRALELAPEPERAKLATALADLSTR